MMVRCWELEHVPACRDGLGEVQGSPTRLSSGVAAVRDLKTLSLAWGFSSATLRFLKLKITGDSSFESFPIFHGWFGETCSVREAVSLST